MTDVYCIGRDQPTKYGTDWAGAFLAGSSYSEYDDQDYFTVEQRLLVHPSVERTQEAVQARITAAIAEACASPDGFYLDMGDNEGGGLDEPGEYSVCWTDIESLPLEITVKHGFVVAYFEWVGNDVDMGWDTNYLYTIDNMEDEDDEDDD